MKITKSHKKGFEGIRLNAKGEGSESVLFGGQSLSSEKTCWRKLGAAEDREKVCG